MGGITASLCAMLYLAVGMEQSITLTTTESTVTLRVLEDGAISSTYNIAEGLLAEKPVQANQTNTTVQANITGLMAWVNATVEEFSFFTGLTQVYEFRPNEHKPTTHYFFGKNLTAPFEYPFFACADRDLIFISRLAFTCFEIMPISLAPTNNTITFDKVVDTNPGSLPEESWAGTYITQVNITDDFTRTAEELDAIRQAVATLAASRLRRIAALQTHSFQVLEHNESRLEGAQTAMLFIYFLISVVSFIAASLLGLLLSWVWAPCNCIKRPPPCSIPSWSSIAWICLLNFFLFLLVGVAGLLGGIIVLVLYLVLLLVMYGYSEVMFRRQFKLALMRGAGDDGHVSNIELQEAGKVGPIHVKGFHEEQLPLYLQPRLTRRLTCVFFITAAISILIIIIIFFGFTAKELQLWSRVEAAPLVEYIPQLTAKGILITYAWPQFATNLQLALFMRSITAECGTKFSKELTNEEKDEQINDAFILQYSMDMSIYEPSDYRQYLSVNDWFVRRLKPGVRPIAEGADVIVSPADARTLAFDAVGNSKVWIKGGLFTVAEMMDDVAGGTGQGLSTNYTNGHMLISRLAPQDYHRFHMPLDGTLLHIGLVSGTFWSVGKDAATSGNYAFYNERTVMIFSNPLVGQFAYVAIGATCVGSVNIEVRTANRSTYPYKVGDFIPKGAELGNMQFGGSTVITLLPRGTVLWDDDLRYAASLPVESYLQMGQRIGVITSQPVPYLPLPSSERTVNVGLGAAPIAGMTIGALAGVAFAVLLFYFVTRKCQGKDIEVKAHSVDGVAPPLERSKRA